MTIRPFAIVAFVAISFGTTCAGGGSDSPGTGGDSEHPGRNGGAKQTSSGGNGQTASGGSEDVTVTEGALSGTRLKATWINGSDGSKQFLSWYDSSMMIDCTFNKLATGKAYCLPPSGLQLMFTDPQCTKPIWSYPTAITCLPKYVTALAYDSCSAATSAHVYPVGAPMTGLTSVYMLSANTCSDFSSSIKSYSFYAAGAEVPLTYFVEGQITHD